MFLTKVKGKSLIPPFSKDSMVLSSESDKAKLFAENVSKKAELDDSGTFLHACPSSTNLKLHNISELPSWVRRS